MSPEEVALDPEMFQCQTCLVMDAVDDLDADNLAAWHLFQQVCTRFLFETRAVGVALSRLTADMDVEAFADMTARLSILYGVYYPPPKKAATE